ncbi:MAG: RNA polymerase sigma24 factor [Rhodothermaceae bacterium]|nr:MAG: RNA polymerase sigma24 factor [Rhodothermaceae bacterium]
MKTARLHPRNRKALLDELSDELLMEQLQAGTVEAFDLLVERYSSKLMRYLLDFLGDPQRAEDLLQDTFLRVYRNRHAYRRFAKFSTWIYTIAGNLARSEYRKNKRRKTTYTLRVGTRDQEEYELPLPDETFSPERETERTFEEQAIQEALAQLSPRYWEVVVLRDVQQLTYDEIAEITGLPMGTVKSRINRGRIRLQQILRDRYGIVPEGQEAEVMAA